MARVLLAGCGDLGTRLGQRLLTQGHDVWGLRRTPSGFPAGLKPLSGDLTKPQSLTLPADLNWVIYTAAPSQRDEESYRRTYVDGLATILEQSRSPNLQRVVFCSSTAVYGQDDGSWVDEDSATVPADYRGQVLLEAEALVHEQRAQAQTVLASVIRLSGIYGPGRTYLLRRAREESPLANGGRCTNRIHIDDAAALFAQILAIEDPASCYVGVDNEPSRLDETLGWLRGELGLPAAPTTGGPSLGKRCRNRLARATGWEPVYPTYREGYRSLLDDLDSDEI